MVPQISLKPKPRGDTSIWKSQFKNQNPRTLAIRGVRERAEDKALPTESLALVERSNPSEWESAQSL